MTPAWQGQNPYQVATGLFKTTFLVTKKPAPTPLGEGTGSNLFINSF
jgi:hypothetical protein